MTGVIRCSTRPVGSTAHDATKQTLRPRSGGWLGAIIIGLTAVATGVGAAPNSGLQETALAPRSAPRGATMFAALPPARTGIVTENDYADPGMWTEHYQELVYGAMGTGVSIGDYDNDGRPDLFVVSKTGQSRMFRNLGDWKFEDVTAKAGLSRATDAPIAAWSQGAIFVDVNNDGWLDLYVCRFGAPNLLYINQHDGIFKEEAAARGLAVVDACGMATFCDYDRDGWLDVYVETSLLDATAHPSGQRDYLFRNQGNGYFVNVTDRAGIRGEAMGHSATWWDYDNDGWPDLYVTSDYSAPDCLYHNNRDGTFTDTLNQVVPHQPYYAMGSDLGDVNNDGLIDLFVADMAATTHEKDQRGMAYSRAQAQVPPPDSLTAPQLMHNALYLNTGTGRCLEAAFLAGLAATDWTWSVRFEDLDNDGRLDLHVTNGMTREYHSVDLLARILSTDGPLESRRIIRASPKLTERHLAFRNLGDLAFTDVSAAWGLDQRGVSFGAAFGDLDGDGDLDLVYANYEGGATVLRNDSDTGHRLIVALSGTQSNRFGVGAVVRIETAAGVQVRPLVLARGYLSSSEPVVHFGLGETTRIQHLTVVWPSGQNQIFDDLAVDRRLTITEPSDPVVQRAAPAPAARGQFSGAPPPALLEPPPDPVRSDNIVASADFDRDGQLDRFVGGRALPGKLVPAPRSALYLNRGGNWEDVTDSVAPELREVGRVTAALCSDVDGDGWPDLLVALDWGRIAYFHNQEGRSFEEWTERAGFSAAGTGWWTSLATADFNGDGRPDYVAGNAGLNTQYRASPEHPALLFYGRFSESGGPLSIEAYYEGDRLFPWRTRKDLGGKIPSILKRYPKNDQYARATLGEILGDDKLAAAQRWSVTDLQSGVFLSQPDGTFRFSPLPRIAQIAPIQHLVAGDFDGDGCADVYAVQNSFAPSSSIGRFDGGLSQLLRGDGQGRFSPVGPSESGLIVTDDTKALVVTDLDLDGWPDFVISRDAAPILAYRNRGIAGRRSVHVVLHGPVGNPTAIGARVTAESADGSTQSMEVIADYGSASRSSAACFFGCPDGHPPKRFRVRWPSGAITTHESPGADATTITLSAPTP